MPIKMKLTNEVFKILILSAVSVFAFIPIYFMLIISVKDDLQFAQHPFRATWPFHFENYVIAWRHVGPYIGRSLFAVSASVFLIVALGSLTAFFIARFEFVGKRFVFGYIIALLMIPGVLNLIPLYILVTQTDSVLRNIRILIRNFRGPKR